MTISRVLCGVAMMACTELSPWVQADDHVVPADHFTPFQEVQANLGSAEGGHEFVEDQRGTARVFSRRRKYPYSAPYVLPSQYYYPAFHYYPRYLEEQDGSKEEMHLVGDGQEEIITVEPAAERHVYHRRRYSPLPNSYYYGHAAYTAPANYGRSSYPRYLKKVRRAAVVDKEAVAESKLWAASRKLRNMGHRRYGYYHVPIRPYYGTYKGYRNVPFGYVRYLY